MPFVYHYLSDGGRACCYSKNGKNTPFVDIELSFLTIGNSLDFLLLKNEMDSKWFTNLTHDRFIKLETIFNNTESRVWPAKSESRLSKFYRIATTFCGFYSYTMCDNTKHICINNIKQNSFYLTFKLWKQTKKWKKMMENQIVPVDQL